MKPIVNTGFVLFILIAIVSLSGEDLWRPGNLYNRPAIVQGSILKLSVDDPVMVEFDYENLRGDDSTVEAEKGRGNLEMIPGAGIERSFSGKKTGRLKVRGNLQFQMAVTVSEINGAGMLVLRGRRAVVREADDTEMIVELQGEINPQDVKADRTIKSAHVANLSLLVRGMPVEKRTGFTMKVTRDEDGNPIYTPALSDEEKARVLMNDLNRVLGETGYVP